MKLDHLDNEDLLDLYTELVRVDHYDPCETPAFVQELRAAGISQHHIKKFILERMQ